MTYIILLRGVNVGGRIIKMAELKSLLEKEKFQDVRTVLQTGNVILNAEKMPPETLETKIAIALEKEFHYPAKLLALLPGQLAGVLEAMPFRDKNTDFHKYVVFTKNGFEKQLIEESPELNPSLEE